VATGKAITLRTITVGEFRDRLLAHPSAVRQATRALRVLRQLPGAEVAKASAVLRRHPWMVSEYEDRIALASRRRELDDRARRGR